MKVQIALLLLLTMGATSRMTYGKEQPMVEIETSKGRIVVALEADKAPVTVSNFLAYVDSGFYDGTIFHRVIPTFMIQGGGFDAALNRKATREPIVNEASHGLSNVRGTIAMARTMVPDSATSQFFLNTADNPSLDYRNDSPQGAGYCVFGRVVEGAEVVEAIQQVATGIAKGMRDVPQEPVVIERVARVDATEPTDDTKAQD